MLAVASTMHAAAGMQVCVNAGTRWDARTLTPLGDDLTADGVGQSDDIQFPFFYSRHDNNRICLKPGADKEIRHLTGQSVANCYLSPGGGILFAWFCYIWPGKTHARYGQEHCLFKDGFLMKRSVPERSWLAPPSPSQ